MLDETFLNKIPIFDGHNDTLKRLFLSNCSVYNSNGNTHIDILRARQAGLKSGFFAIMAVAENPIERESGYGLKLSEQGWSVEYPKRLRQEYAQSFTDSVIEYFLKETREDTEVQIVKNFRELSASLFTDRLSIVLHFEGAEAIKADLSNLEKYYDKGLRSLGLVWSRANDFGYGVPFRFPNSPDIGGGLTASGKQLVKRCNELGILIDLAHINEKGFFDVVGISKNPIVVSHTGVHSICKSSTNLTDRQIDAVRDSNGVIGIIFDVLNTRSDGRFIRNTPLDIILEHMEYIIHRIGINYVSFGSDFDGGVLPDEIKDVTGLRKLVHCLQRLGYNQEEIEKVCYKNWMRVIGDTWRGEK